MGIYPVLHWGHGRFPWQVRSRQRLQLGMRVWPFDAVDVNTDQCEDSLGIGDSPHLGTKHDCWPSFLNHDHWPYFRNHDYGHSFGTIVTGTFLEPRLPIICIANQTSVFIEPQLLTTFESQKEDGIVSDRVFWIASVCNLIAPSLRVRPTKWGHSKHHY